MDAQALVRRWRGWSIPAVAGHLAADHRTGRETLRRRPAGERGMTDEYVLRLAERAAVQTVQFSRPPLFQSSSLDRRSSR